MANKILCQSCSMPLDNDELKGSEKNGSKSNEFCIYCYEKGVFKNPSISLAGMKDMVKSQMVKMNLPEQQIKAAVAELPKLARWKNYWP
ncbi:MAG: zinc ribbon domain-containing protein [Saprospiraceae bacterium]|nr:zinc ribbon domain-containing protein [Saprospiraceae bacterium]